MTKRLTTLSSFESSQVFMNSANKKNGLQVTLFLFCRLRRLDFSLGHENPVSRTLFEACNYTWRLNYHLAIENFYTPMNQQDRPKNLFYTIITLIKKFISPPFLNEFNFFQKQTETQSHYFIDSKIPKVCCFWKCINILFTNLLSR